MPLAARQMQLASSGRVFSPGQISGLALWLRADSLSLSDTDPVASWTDVSGNGRHATQATGGKQPLFRTNILNTTKPVVRFAGTDDCLVTPTIDFTGTQKLTVFIVASAASGGTQILVEAGSAVGNFATSFVVYRGAGNTILAQHLGDVGYASSTAGASLTTTAAVITAEFNKTLAASEATHRINGVAASVDAGNDNNNTNAFGNHVLNIGARDNGVQFPLTGDIAELIIYNTSLSSTQRGQVEGYLSTKYGI